MNKNEKLNLHIENYGCNAEGVTYHDDNVVFVPYSLVGEDVEVNIINSTKKYCIGKVLDIKNKSEKIGWKAFF